MKREVFLHKGISYGLVRWEYNPAIDSKDHKPVALVLVHGFAQSSCSWSEVAPWFARTHVVYAFELLGHGGSQRPDNSEPYALKEQAASLLAFLQSIEMRHQKPQVIAYSMGGRVALSAAAIKPQAFGCLLLESAGLGPKNVQSRTEALKRDMLCAAHLRREGLSSFIDFWEGLALFATQRNLPDKVQKCVRAVRMSNDAEALARTFERAGQHAMDDAETALRAIEELRTNGIQVGYITGSCDGKYKALADQLQGLCEVHIITGAGHDVHLEKSRAFCRVASRFLSNAFH